MRNSKAKMILGLVCGLLVGHSAWAGRTMRMPGYARRWLGLQPATTAPSGQVLIFLDYYIKMVNLDSANTQSGTVSLVGGTYGQIGVRDATTGAAIPSTIYYWVCSDTAQMGTNSLPTGSANWSIPPGSSKNLVFAVGASFAPPTTGAGASFDFFTDVSALISVTNDKGAILASMFSTLEWAVTGGDICGTSLNPWVPGIGPSSPPERSFPPLLINGGRPF